MFVEESDGSDFDTMYSSVIPLQTVRLHSLIEVPIEVQQSGKPYDIILSTDRDIKLIDTDGSQKEIIMADEIEFAKNLDIECDNEISLNSLIAKEDYAELTITTYESTNEVNPQNETAFSMGYLNTEEDQTYIHFVSDLKSLQTESEDSSSMFDIDVYYDNCYLYNGFSTLEYQDGSDFSMSSYIDPLTTEKVHHVVKVPIFIVEDEKPLIAIITLGGYKYKYTIR